jgi:predicted nucleotidyltransferase
MKVISNLDLIVILEITKNLNRKWSINELSGAINKHYKPTYVAVQRLIDNQILRKNSNALIEPLFKNTLLYEIAEKKRILDFKNKTIYIIQNKIEKIKDSYFSMILFGSSVYKRGQDIDLLIIIPNLKEINEFEQKIKKTLGSFYSEIDLNIINEDSCYEMLNKPNQLNVMNEILKNHLALIGIENFYRILKRWKNDK